MSRHLKRLVKGFGITEVVLVAIIIALIGGVVIYINHVNSTATATYDEANDSAATPLTPAPRRVTDKACKVDGLAGQVATIESDAFEFCLPKGWALHAEGGSLYEAASSNLQYDADKPATIRSGQAKQQTFDFTLTAMTESSYNKSSSALLSQYKSVTAPALQHGDSLNVAAYTRTVGRTSKTDWPIGTKQYLYVVTMPGSTIMGSVLEISYSRQPGSVDLASRIQAIVTTVHMPASMEM